MNANKDPEKKAETPGRRKHYFCFKRLVNLSLKTPNS